MPCRCRDLPEHMVSKQRYCRAVLIIPGPKPACMDPYLDALGKELARLSTGVLPGLLRARPAYGLHC